MSLYFGPGNRGKGRWIEVAFILAVNREEDIFAYIEAFNSYSIKCLISGFEMSNKEED